MLRGGVDALQIVRRPHSTWDEGGKSVYVVVVVLEADSLVSGVYVEERGVLWGRALDFVDSEGVDGMQALVRGSNLVGQVHSSDERWVHNERAGGADAQTKEEGRHAVLIQEGGTSTHADVRPDAIDRGYGAEERSKSKIRGKSP